jgi:outer membrane immunogenic protein
VNDSFLVDLGPFNATTFADEVKTDWFATVRGRLGYSFGRFLPYVTGGLAIAHEKAGLSVNGTFGGGRLPVAFASSQSKTLTGYAVGAGAEYALNRSWSIKAEYLHVGFDDRSFDLSGSLSVAGVPVALTASGNVATDFDIARFGVNYRF